MKSVPKKILIINHFGIGDVIFTLPIVSNLKAHYPDVQIGYICNSRVEPMLKNHKDISKIFVYDRDDYNNIYKRSKIDFFKKIKCFMDEIKRENYDIVFDCSLNTMFSVFTCFAGIKRRIGFNYKNRSYFLTDKFDLKGFEGKHVVEFYLELLENVGLEVKKRDLSLAVSSDDDLWAENVLKDGGLSRNKPIIGVMPGAGASWGAEAKYRRWPADKYEKLVDKMIENLSAQIILMGDATESVLCEKLAQRQDTRILQACGQTSIGQLSALLKKCDVVVLNDGGPLHLSVAVGVNTVSIFGPVDSNVYGPFGDSKKHVVVTSDVVCRPCYKRFRMVPCEHINCLQRISVDAVFNGVNKFIK